MNIELQGTLHGEYKLAEVPEELLTADPNETIRLTDADTGQTIMKIKGAIYDSEASKVR
ncbi:MAG: hypothetical protein MRY32_06590 [Rickettsiales bacterium]|nr:hypothetical protein [Rickettsiales bacterium]